MTGAVLPLGVTMGEPAGIGGEIVLKAWLRRRAGRLPFFAIDDPERLRNIASRLELPVPVSEIEAPESAGQVFGQSLPVLAEPLRVPSLPGKLDPANAPAVISAIDRAIALVRERRIDAVVTNPIHKKCLYDAGFHHPGHTEYLASLIGPDIRPVMMLACPGLRAVPVTIHMPLRQAVESLSREAIVHCATVTAESLSADFGIAAPRIAISGLNPHAGEDGSLGTEETEIIAPAIATLAAAGIAVEGPLPADSLFHEAARQAYDAVICMYHDQALIPIKTIGFSRGINITLGLPFIRTSPDHGTA
ncbi:MAG: 4-hydroxythreonine-4-phosphate dehydrogenase PdxA, partial [Alphaproteobacteria bacterium]